MRILARVVGALGVLALIWAGLWFAASVAVERNVVHWLATGGAEADSVNVGGFPLALRTDITGLAIRDPAADLSWTVPAAVISQPAVRPNSAAAEITGPHRLDWAGVPITITHDTLSGNAAVALMEGGALSTVRLTATEAEVTAPDLSLSPLSAETVDVAVERRGHAGYAVELALDGARAFEAPGDLRISAVVELDHPLDHGALSGTVPRIQSLRVTELTGDWGGMVLTVSGMVSVDPQGFPDGELRVQAADWAAGLRAAEAAGLFGPEGSGPVGATLAILAASEGSPEHIDTTLVFFDGRIFLGPVPLGPAPRLAPP
ncbi:MAG: DUF2125 domain-containing protein [Pseudomonadota bacterium]